MIEWSDEHLMIRDAVRSFIEAEIKPNLEELEHGDTPPYDVLRKLYQTFGIDAMAAGPASRSQIARRGRAGGGPSAEDGRAGVARTRSHAHDPDHRAVPLLPGHGDRAGRERGLTAAAIMSQGTTAQKERWALAAADAREDRRLGDHRARLGLRRLRRR